MTVNEIAIERYQLALKDSAAPESVHLDAHNIKLRLGALSTVKNRQAKIFLSCGIGKKGSLSSNGTIKLNPFGTRLNVQLKDFDISPLQSYVGEKVKLRVTKGLFSTSGNLSLESSRDGKYVPSYSGEAYLRKFATIDDLNGDDFLKWESLALNGMDLRLSPTYVAVKQVSLTDFYSRITINPDGSLLPIEIVTSENASPEPQKKPDRPGPGLEQTAGKEPKPRIKIQTVTLQGGRIDFKDRHIKPNYAAKLDEVSGKISGLSSEETIFADVDLFAKLDNYAPLEITGKINPLRDDLFVDLKASFKNMELGPLTPYSGRYLGYTIEKGKLSFTLQYQIVKKKLDSQNNIYFDQLTLGEQVESPDATKLPVRLAIALLKDRQGKIDLNIPVSGTLDDPQFSVGRIIIKIIVNLITKAATAPFALLGAIFGGGEELSYIEFDYGAHDLTQANAAKLDKLATALYGRPNLKLDIEGYVDRDKDKEGLRQLFFKRKIKARKLQDMIKKGTPALLVDEVSIWPEEYKTYLKKAYSKEKFPKPRNIIGLEKDLPPSEMEKLMLAHTEISDDDLRQLTSLRTQEVQSHILKSGKVEPERIFLIEAPTLAPKEKEKLRKSRVDFRLH